MVLGPLEHGGGHLVRLVLVRRPVTGLNRVRRELLLGEVLGRLGALELAGAVHAKVGGEADAGVLGSRRRRRAGREVIHGHMAVAVGRNWSAGTATHFV